MVLLTARDKKASGGNMYRRPFDQSVERAIHCKARFRRDRECLYLMVQTCGEQVHSRYALHSEKLVG